MEGPLEGLGLTQTDAISRHKPQFRLQSYPTTDLQLLRLRLLDLPYPKEYLSDNKKRTKSRIKQAKIRMLDAFNDKKAALEALESELTRRLAIECESPSFPPHSLQQSSLPSTPSQTVTSSGLSTPPKSRKRSPSESLHDLCPLCSHPTSRRRPRSLSDPEKGSVNRRYESTTDSSSNSSSQYASVSEVMNLQERFMEFANFRNSMTQEFEHLKYSLNADMQTIKTHISAMLEALKTMAPSSAQTNNGQPGIYSNLSSPPPHPTPPIAPSPFQKCGEIVPQSHLPDSQVRTLSFFFGLDDVPFSIPWKDDPKYILDPGLFHYEHEKLQPYGFSKLYPSLQLSHFLVTFSISKYLYLTSSRRNNYLLNVSKIKDIDSHPYSFSDSTLVPCSYSTISTA